MKKKIIRWLQIGGGILLIILGIIGLFLPFLQGILFIFAGITLISPAHGKKMVNKIKIWWKKKHKNNTSSPKK